MQTTEIIAAMFGVTFAFTVLLHAMGFKVLAFGLMGALL